MSVRRAALVLLALAAAGCAVPPDEPRLEPSGVEPAPLPEGSFWMVWAHGEERSTCRGPLCSRAVCSIVFDHEVRPDVREFRHADRDAPAQPWLVVAFTQFDEGDCPVGYGHGFNESSMATRMGAFGDLALDVTEDGALRANGHEVPLGQRAVFEYGTRQREGWFAVENLGAWPWRASLSTAAPSAPSAAPS